MKWPKYLMLIRHDVSAYNALKKAKEESVMYQMFLKSFESDPESAKTRNLARRALRMLRLNCGDHDTKLAAGEGHKSEATGRNLQKSFHEPEVIFVSPYARTLKTLEHLKKGWPELKDVKIYEDERLREQEHGLALIYNDWRLFHALHPEQRMLYEIEGRYWYRYPQGENVPDVRLRNRSWLSTVIRDFAEKKVLVVTHHLNILAMRANLERLSAEEFVHLDEKEKPINCGVTLYIGHEKSGENGRLSLDFYNKKYY